MNQPLIADTGGLLRALANDRDGRPAWPAFAAELTKASAIIVPPLILAEVDYFLRNERAAARKLLAEIFDPGTTYELEPIAPGDIVRAMEIDAKFAELRIGLVDGSVAAIAERRKVYRVLTIDHSHFNTIRVGTGYRQALAVCP